MATLDYAFLADYARVETNGTLTAIGASWTFIEVATLPAVHRMAVAGRVRGRPDESPIPFRVEISGPDGTFKIGADGALSATGDARPYGEGWLGYLFALDVQVPLPAVGLYSVRIFVQDEQARYLAFDVVTPA